MEARKYDAATLICAQLGDGDRPKPLDLVYLSEHGRYRELDELYRRAVQNLDVPFEQVTAAWKVLADV
jgi:hypothetical protein